MPDNAHDVGLTTFVVNCVAHDFSVNGKAFILLAVYFIPALQGTVEMHGIDSNDYVADDRKAWHDVAVVYKSTTKSLPGLLTKALGPIRDGLIALPSA